MGRSKKEPLDQAPEHIPQEERFKLWIRSGGRCAICNKYLLEDEFTAHELNLAEAAHIVGRSKGGPRGQEDLPIEERNLADNLMLLCQDHHTLIDHGRKLGFFPRKHLLEIKDAHEKRIRELTGLVENRETTVLRMIGDIRGAATTISAEHAQDTVYRSALRYPRWHLGIRNQLEIDLRNIPDEGSDAYWQTCKRKIDISLEKLRDGVGNKLVQHVSVFGFARIPLLVYLGSMLSDKVPIDLYQRHRTTDTWTWTWPDPEAAVAFEIVRWNDGDPARGIVLVLQLSGTIAKADLPSELSDLPCYVIQPATRDSGVDLFASAAVLESFGTCFREFLALSEREAKVAPAIHAFPAAPITAAIEVGRRLLRGVHPEMHVYDRDSDGRFRFALAVNTRASKSERLMGDN